MRKPRLLLWMLALATVLSAPVSAQGVPHIDLLVQMYGRTVEDHLVEVRAAGGQPQPASWQYFVLDPVQPGEMVKYTVTEGEVSDARRISAGAGGRQVFDPDQVQITPLQAFQAAERRAIQAGIGFNWADYSLLFNPRTAAPEWQLGLFNGDAVLVGAVRLSAVDGTILETRWASQGQAIAESGVGVAPPPAGNEVEGTGIGEGAATIGQGAADIARGIGRGIGEGLDSIGRWMQRQ